MIYSTKNGCLILIKKKISFHETKNKGNFGRNDVFELIGELKNLPSIRTIVVQMLKSDQTDLFKWTFLAHELVKTMKRLVDLAISLPESKENRSLLVKATHTLKKMESKQSWIERQFQRAFLKLEKSNAKKIFEQKKERAFYVLKKHIQENVSLEKQENVFRIAHRLNQKSLLSP